MDFVDPLAALTPDDTKRSLAIQLLATNPPSFASAGQIVASFATIPPALFKANPDDSRLLSEQVAVQIGYARFSPQGDAAVKMKVAGYAVLSQGDPDGLLGYVNYAEPVEVNFHRNDFIVSLAISCEVTSVGI